MAKKKPEFRSLQKGRINDHYWELLQSTKNRLQYNLLVQEAEIVEREEVTIEKRIVPTETTEKREILDEKGKLVKDKKGQGTFENVIRKGKIIEDVKVVEMIKHHKLHTIKTFTFYFRPYHFQIVKNIKTFLKTLKTK